LWLLRHGFYGGRDMELDDIVAEVHRLAAPLVLLTGGEPMLQREIVALAERLLAEGFKVMIETSGAHPVDVLPEGVVRIVDIKTPGSGEVHRVRWDVVEGLRPRDAIKFVLTDEADYRWAADAIRSRDLAAKAEVLLSPVHGQLQPRDLVAWMLRDRLPARLNLQLHKYVWGADAQGV
jgi:7-carboxy-7-deazaguanine synthase